MNTPTSSLRWPSGLSRRTPLQIGGVVIGLTLIGACQTSTARRSSPRFETAFVSAASDRSPPLVFIPNSGAVTSVQETHSTAGLRQRIQFGRSRGRVDLTIASGQVWDDPAMARPSQAGIAAELASLEDGGSYRIVRQPVRNAYGPLGVALNERCAYAWQWIDGSRNVELGRGALRGPVSVSLRVQHCRPQPTVADALLADLARMRLGVTSLTAERAPRARIARSRPAAEIAATEAPVAQPSAPKVQSQSQPPGPPQGPPLVAINSSRTLVMLPPPPSGPAFLVQPAPAPASQAVPAVPRPTTVGGSPDRARFLTDALPTASRASGAAPQPAAAGVPTPPSGTKPPPRGW